MNNTQIRVATGQGELIAKLCDDPNYPGVWLAIDRPEFGNSVTVILFQQLAVLRLQ